MILYILGLLLVAIGLGALALQRLYSSIPLRELKRLAARGDQLAALLYRPAGYGASLRLLLWLVLGLSWSAGLILLVPTLPAMYALALLLALSVVVFVWLPSLRLTKSNAQAAGRLAPVLTWLLSRLHPVLDPVSRFIQERRNLEAHSQLYEPEDLLALIEQQKEQTGNRIAPQILDLASRTLTFGERRAAHIVRPRKDTYVINADDTIGPVLLDKLHQAGQSTFLVYKDKPNNIIGSVSMTDAVRAKHGGRIFDLVRGDLAFVHEDFSLPEVLAAFQKTSQRLLVVVNSFEEFVGVITFDQLIHELLGNTVPDKEMAYDNRSVVAAYRLEPQVVPIEEPEAPVQEDLPETEP